MAKSARSKSSETPVLDQGIAITGDLVVKLFGLNVLPIKVRLLISSKDLAAELGLDWWQAEGVRKEVRQPASRGKKDTRTERKSRLRANSPTSRRAAGRNGSGARAG